MLKRNINQGRRGIQSVIRVCSFKLGAKGRPHWECDFWAGRWGIGNIDRRLWEKNVPRQREQKNTKVLRLECAWWVEESFCGWKEVVKVRISRWTQIMVGDMAGGADHKEFYRHSWAFILNEMRQRSDVNRFLFLKDHSSCCRNRDASRWLLK